MGDLVVIFDNSSLNSPPLNVAKTSVPTDDNLF